jgi:hypothetical protein
MELRNILISLQLLIACTGFTQDISNLEKEFEWEKIEIRSFDSVDLEKIFPLIKNLPFRTKDEALEHLDFFHLVDYNNDLKIDIFYNGWTGGEGTMLQIIQNTGNGFKIVQTLFGTVKDLQTNNNCISTIEVLDYSCCAGYIDHLQSWSLDQITEKYVIKSDIAYVVGFKIPDKKFDMPIMFEIVNERYNMRTEPEIINIEPHSAPFDPIENQNISASFTTGDTGVAIAESTDSTGRIWWLVIMDNKPSTNYPTIFYEGNNDIFDYKTLGWISSRYIKK